MKILFTIANANLKGGTEILAFHLLHELNANGMECKLLSVVPYHGNDNMVESFTQEDFKRWEVIENSPLNKITGSARSDAFLCQLIIAKAEELGVEWIVNHTYDICAAIPVKTRFKTAQVFNWSIKGYESSLESLIRKKSLIGRMLSTVGLYVHKKRWHSTLPLFTRLVMLTDSAHAEIRGISPLVKDKQLVTIPDPLIQTEDSKVQSSLQNKNIVFVGRLSYEKGVMRLLRIWEKLSRHLPGYTLQIYGTGDVQGEMESFIRERHIEGVSFMGFCNDLEKIYSNADLLMMTSDSEGFGMVLIEAMYYGVPCITFDCPVSPKEIIADAGIAIPCFDEELYTTEVIKLIQNTDRMKEFQAKAIKRASNFIWDGYKIAPPFISKQSYQSNNTRTYTIISQNSASLCGAKGVTLPT